MNNLRVLRKLKDMTQDNMAKLFNINRTTYGKWEQGLHTPDTEMLVELANYFNVTIDYLLGVSNNTQTNVQVKHDYLELIKKYDALDPHGKELVNLIIDKETERVKEAEKIIPIQKKSNMYSIPYYGKAVSAGTGEYLFDDMIKSNIPVLDTELVRKADLAIGVNGDSMSPLYDDGDIVLVKKQESVNLGEMGVFIINNESYIKILGKDGLISFNPAYDDIIAKESDISCIGKVIGSVTNPDEDAKIKDEIDDIVPRN